MKSQCAVLKKDCGTLVKEAWEFCNISAVPAGAEVMYVNDVEELMAELEARHPCYVAPGLSYLSTGGYGTVSVLTIPVLRAAEGRNEPQRALLDRILCAMQHTDKLVISSYDDGIVDELLRHGVVVEFSSVGNMAMKDEKKASRRLKYRNNKKKKKNIPTLNMLACRLFDNLVAPVEDLVRGGGHYVRLDWRAGRDISSTIRSYLSHREYLNGKISWNRREERALFKQMVRYLKTLGREGYDAYNGLAKLVKKELKLEARKTARGARRRSGKTSRNKA